MAKNKNKVSTGDIKRFYRRFKNNKPILILAVVALIGLFIFTKGQILDTSGSPILEEATKIFSSSVKPKPSDRNPGTVADGDNLIIRVQDIGQGDSILIQTPSKNILIDAAEPEYADRIIENIHNAGIEKLDFVIATHPHADHIGGMRKVLNAVPADKIIMSPKSHTTATYRKLLETIDTLGIELITAKPGMVFDMGDGAVLNILGPVKDFKDLNDASVITRLDFGKKSFLFSGDAEKEAEAATLANGADIDVDMMVAGHHGSSTSTTDPYFAAASPEYVAISCGVGNDYGHPHEETLQRIEGLIVNRTDLEGTITYVCDGETIEVSTEK